MDGKNLIHTAHVNFTKQARMSIAGALFLLSASAAVVEPAQAGFETVPVDVIRLCVDSKGVAIETRDKKSIRIQQSFIQDLMRTPGVKKQIPVHPDWSALYEAFDDYDTGEKTHALSLRGPAKESINVIMESCGATS